MLGSWLGGKLSDRFYRIMVFLFTSGILLFSYNTYEFWELCAGMFIIMTVADMFRPAMFVSWPLFKTGESRLDFSSISSDVLINEP
jgi:predicted MFS family arabinose efflux permease